ncbi:host attachment protein [Luteolibacter flavescens]|uniref:Host attachment protein n=1 Tax=Luteolibacter flavescens TaxID=1859460 RepID=A0ABT3FSD8_9BACT|nr:host attachment protein [Luteolibacter flavescens]MCW1886498.1 host attachment protein [Luteolibacter flavescens]
MEPLIILSNLGRVRALAFRAAGDDPRQQDHLSEIPNSRVELRPQSVTKVVTDQAGRAPQSGPVGLAGGMSFGEMHGLETELEKQALARIAMEIGDRVAEEGNPRWHLVAPATILPALQKALPAEARKTLASTSTGDLTKLPIAKLEAHLMHGSASK